MSNDTMAGTNLSVVVDMEFDAAGRLRQQTVPYATAYENGFHLFNC